MTTLALMQDLSDPLAVARQSLPFVQRLFPALEVPLDLPVFSDAVLLGPQRKAFDDLYQREKPRFTILMMNLHRLARWASFHVPVIELSSGLLSALLLTDPASVEWDEIHPPFDTFAVRVPPLWRLDDPEEGNPVVTALWFHRYDVSDAAYTAQTMNLEGYDRQSVLGSSTSQWLLTEIAGHMSVVIEQQPWQAMSLAKWLNYKRARDAIRPGEDPCTVQDIHLQLAVRRLYINLCLYIAERGLGAVRPQRRACRYTKRGQAEAAGLSTNWLLGVEIPFDQTLHDAAKAWTETRRRQRAGWRVMKRTVVRGHWRNQACGLARAERRRIWIMPHPRGGGLNVGHRYREVTR